MPYIRTVYVHVFAQQSDSSLEDDDVYAPFDVDIGGQEIELSCIPNQSCIKMRCSFNSIVGILLGCTLELCVLIPRNTRELCSRRVSF